MTHNVDYVCTQREPKCPVHDFDQAHIRRMKDLDDAMKRIETIRYERDRAALINRHCKGCGFEWTENEIRKEHPAPWVRKNDGTVYRDWRRQG